MKKIKRITAVLVFMLYACTLEGTIIRPAPDFNFPALDGSEISLWKLQGKVVVLNFWGTWCTPCKAEIPGFNQLHEKYSERGLRIIGISLDKIGKKRVADFVSEYKMSYPNAMATAEFIKDYEPGRALPVTIIIDPSGQIREKHIGFMEKETWAF